MVLNINSKETAILTVVFPNLIGVYWNYMKNELIKRKVIWPRYNTSFKSETMGNDKIEK